MDDSMNHVVVAGRVYRQVAEREVEELHVFDFDNCLFRSPDKPPWWTDKHWWTNEASLLAPCVPEEPSASWWVSDVVSAAKKSIRDDTIYTLMITGRVQETFSTRITDLLVQKELRFDELRFKQTKSEKTSEYKARHVRAVAKKFPKGLKRIQIWDDNQDNLDEVKAHLEEKGYEVITHLVVGEMREVDCTKKDYEKKVD